MGAGHSHTRVKDEGYIPTGMSDASHACNSTRGNQIFNDATNDRIENRLMLQSVMQPPQRVGRGSDDQGYTDVEGLSRGR